MSSQRRQIMQPWPLCLISFSKNKDRQILPKYYTRVSSRGKLSAPCTTITQDCASNTTLLTNTSDFNSHQTLITDPNQIKIINNTDKKNQTHYYAENIRHENDLGHKTIYNPLKDLDIVEYKQLQPLLVENKNHIGVKEVDMLMESQEQRDENEMADRKSSGLPTRHYRKKQKNIFTYASQVLAALSVSLGSMVVGFSCSYTSPATVSMRNINITLFEVNEHMSSWIGSIMPLTAIFGGIAGGPSIEYLGRRNTILATAFPFIGAWLFIAMASNVWLILIGRALSGFCVGIASLSLPVYLGETIQPEVRGTLGLLPTAFGNIGILLCYIAGMYLNWYNLAFFGALLPIPFLLLMFLIPETPRWYVSKGKTKRARKSLQWLRGNNVDVTEELTAVEKTHIDSEKNSSQGTMSELLKGSHIKLLFLSLGLMFFQQMSGINAVIFYTEKIFKDAGSTIDSSLSAMIVGVVNFASTFVATALIDRLGRKILLYISSVTMIITLICLGAFFYMKNTNYDVSNIGWLPLVCLVTYVIGFSLGFGPIPWLMMGEILPAKIRGPAASIATGFNWTCTFIITKTFQNVMSIIGAASTFWIFGGVCVVGLMFVILFIPETRGRSLEEIEKRLTGPVRRMSSVANMKPMPTAC